MKRAFNSTSYSLPAEVANASEAFGALYSAIADDDETAGCVITCNYHGPWGCSVTLTWPDETGDAILAMYTTAGA